MLELAYLNSLILAVMVAIYLLVVEYAKRGFYRWHPAIDSGTRGETADLRD